MDQTSSLSNNFDLNSQAGVMVLLASIRASALSPADKNELRDLVFLYTNGGGDASVRITLERKLSIANITLVSNKKTTSVNVAPTPVLSFGSSRPAPVFNKTPSIISAAKTDSVVVPIPAPIPARPIPVHEPVLAPLPAPDPVAAAVLTPAPVPHPTVVSLLPTQPVSVPAAVPTTSYLERIREIKTAVNSKVGNPVNLVDINNEVGREYMNALLEAMKGLSGGAPGQIDFAMQRLEVAYLAVEVAVANHSKKALVTEVTQITTPMPVSQPVPVPVPLVTMVTPASIPIAPRPTAQSSTVILDQQPESVQAFTPSIEEPTQVLASPIQSRPVPEPLKPMEAEVSGYEIAQAQPPQPAPKVNQTPSVAQSNRVLTPQDLPLASTVTGDSDVDGLFTREIDEGLEQLLSDWSLFKKSGLFGTGPKGREHPLFKKLAILQIPLLLAGRFEGSTQDIKQSITDYMNGWRYEQGIMYEQGETFERYLRRVIKKILDLQKKRRPA